MIYPANEAISAREKMNFLCSFPLLITPLNHLARNSVPTRRVKVSCVSTQAGQLTGEYGQFRVGLNGHGQGLK